MDGVLSVAILGVWLVVIAEAVVLFALARTVGLLQLQLGPMPGALVTDDGPPLGGIAPAIAGPLARGRAGFSWQSEGASALLLFVTPTCGMCRQILRDAARVALANHYGTPFVAISYGSPEQNRLIAPPGETLPCVSDDTGAIHTAYGVQRTPMAVHVVDGRVQSKGVVNNRDQIERMLEGDAHHGPGNLWQQIAKAEDLDAASTRA